MRFELLLVATTAFIVFNIHTDWMYVKRALAAKKYLHMGGVVLGALFLYYLIKRNPLHAKDILLTSNEYVKYLPIDKHSADVLSPVLDFTARNVLSSEAGVPSLSGRGGGSRMATSGKQGNKRSVSETKKKFVAARQNWRCGSCEQQLPAWFEVDHKVRLDRGGSNHIDNLVALCRNCHGEKTAVENL